MNINIKKNKDVFELQKFAQIALKHALYENDTWIIKQALVQYSTGSVSDDASISLAYLNKKPIAILLLKPSLGKTHLSVYVQPEHRLKGIGKMLCETVTESVVYAEGISGSLYFYKKTLKHQETESFISTLHA